MAPQSRVHRSCFRTAGRFPQSALRSLRLLSQPMYTIFILLAAQCIQTQAHVATTLQPINSTPTLRQDWAAILQRRANNSEQEGAEPSRALDEILTRKYSLPLAEYGSEGADICPLDHVSIDDEATCVVASQYRSGGTWRHANGSHGAICNGRRCGRAYGHPSAPDWQHCDSTGMSKDLESDSRLLCKLALCKSGIPSASGDVCCAAGCGTCDDTRDCGARTGGAKECCPTEIRTVSHMCSSKWSTGCVFPEALACAVPPISEGIESWYGGEWDKPGLCNTGHVLQGSSCLIKAQQGFTCTSPGRCSNGEFQHTAVCEPNSCDASSPPANGAVGNCTKTLASGSTCQPTCNSGYILSGSSSCTTGTLTTATCQELNLECTDKPTPWMTNHGESCATSKRLKKKCNKKRSWRKRQICRQSCFDAGFGYDGDDCSAKAEADCASFKSCPPSKPVKKGHGAKCSGTCDVATCCEAQDRRLQEIHI